MKKTLGIFLGIAAAITLAACQQGSAPPAQTPASTSTVGLPTTQSSGKPEIFEGSHSLLSVEPATTPTCSAPVVATVKWDLHIAQPNIKSMSIRIGDGPAAPLFAEGTVVGEQKTGVWTVPGTKFVLRDKLTGQVLDEVTIGGPACK